MIRVPPLAFALLLVPSVALAQAAPPSRALQPHQVDVFALGEGSTWASGGVGADVGLWPLGAGRLSLGAELLAGVCLGHCLLLQGSGFGFGTLDDGGPFLLERGAVPASRLTRFLMPSVRLAYHHGVGGFDLYGLAAVGVAPHDRVRVLPTSEGPTVFERELEVPPVFSAGGGARYLFGEHFFAGGELRVRYSHLETAQPDISFPDGTGVANVVSVWSLWGLSLGLSAGARF